MEVCNGFKYSRLYVGLAMMQLLDAYNISVVSVLFLHFLIFSNLDSGWASLYEYLIFNECFAISVLCMNLYWNGSKKPPEQIPYPFSIALVLFGSALVFSLIAFVKGGPSSVLAAIAKSGFTAAFTLIFVSEIGDKVSQQVFFCFFPWFWLDVNVIMMV